MHKIEATFKQQKDKNRSRRNRKLLRRLRYAGVGIVAIIIISAIAVTWDKWSLDIGGNGDIDPADVAQSTQELRLEFVQTIIDLAGDPLIISIGRSSDGPPKVRRIASPAAMADQRVSENLQVLADTMLSSSQRFMISLPSRPQDFAFFQAQSGRRQDIIDQQLDETTPQETAKDGLKSTEDADVIINEPGAGWGETLSDGEKELPAIRKTKIANNTSIVETTREAERFRRTEDYFVRVLSTRTLDSFLLERKINPTDAKLAGETMKSLLGLENLEPGYVVAIRALKPSALTTSLQLVQVSIYNIDTYLGTLTISDDGKYVAGADPWIRDDLFDYSDERKDTGPKRQYRLLDAIYSTAVRNNLSSAVRNETIQLMSRAYNLDAFAEPDDRLMIIFSKQARDSARNTGRVLYVGLQGANKNLECFSFRANKKKAGYSCMSQAGQVHSLTIRNGMITPVNGVLTSRFGPRKHPVLKTVRIHKGVDWAAPTGTPVFAAFKGKIRYAGDGGNYGNLVKISHGAGKETRYAHLNGFAPNARVGQKVKAGDIIGYVGTTGRSTGPHLHFELYRGKIATDPLAMVITFSGGGKSVDVLVNRIIRIESGGNADAKNPLSSASGLGQFISSTWLKMINRYRPDLAKTLSRQEILNLRFDPTISREMLYKFTHENQAYLRARGHAITPGRLYLAHFLGSEGANTILRSPPDSTIAEVMGSEVVSANPFLTGWDVAKIVAWAERKMSRGGKKGAGRVATVSTKKKIIKASPEFLRFRAAIQNLVRSAKAVL